MSSIETSGRNTPEAPQTIDEARVMGVFDSLAMLILPGKQTAETIDQFTHQQLIVGLKELGIHVKGTNERFSRRERSTVTYFFAESSPMRKRNFMLLTWLGREVNKDKVAEELSIPPQTIEASGKGKGRRRRVNRVRATVLSYTMDLSPVYNWQKKVVEKLKQEHSDSVFVKGLQQALIDYLPEE